MQSGLGGAAAIVVLAAISLGGCLGASPPAAASLPASLSCRPPVQTKGGAWIFYACSAPVKLGVPCRFRLYTHCGLGYGPDFDGSFWTTADSTVATSDNPPAGLGDPYDRGTIELVSQDHADYEGASGKTFRLRRLPGHQVVRALCS